MRARLRVGEIALACGFDDVSYLNPAFRRRFGALPTQFRGRGGRAPGEVPQRVQTKMRSSPCRSSACSSVRRWRSPSSGENLISLT
nr:helix-turn-helix domain-containing protein [Bosea thiooxidans]